MDTAHIPWRWHPTRVVPGYGVASGRALDSPYPSGTIALQAPLFAARGLDLSGFYPGTINLSFDDSRWQLSHPDACFEQLLWTDRHPPETFSFWRVALRWQGQSVPLEGLLYWPHPETKRNHHQQPDRLEVLAPWIADLAGCQALELGVDPRRCRRVQLLRLQAHLLEALKFRVLASQQAFFTGFGVAAEPEGPKDWPQGPAPTQAFRQWLATVLPEALALDDDELLLVLQRAWALYCDRPFGSNRDSGKSPAGLP
jgi:hypothetical protein